MRTARTFARDLRRDDRRRRHQRTPGQLARDVAHDSPRADGGVSGAADEAADALATGLLQALIGVRTAHTVSIDNGSLDEQNRITIRQPGTGQIPEEIRSARQALVETRRNRKRPKCSAAWRARATARMSAFRQNPKRERVRRFCAAVVVTSAAALILAGEALAVPAFRTPDQGIYCGVVEAYEVPPSDVPPPLTCWRPRNGFTVYLYALRGAGTHWNPNNKGASASGSARVLPFRQQWWQTGGRSGFGSAPRGLFYWCFNRTTGLTCANRVGHGFWLGRRRGVWLF